MGLPTPNLFTGMQEIHGPLEWVSVQDMARATEVCIKLAELWTGAGSGKKRRKAVKPKRSKQQQAGAAVDWTG
jgi:tripeptide aminopeptidase